MVTSMIAFDVANDDPQNYGFVGAYGDRTANFVVAQSNLVITNRNSAWCTAGRSKKRKLCSKFSNCPL